MENDNLVKHPEKSEDFRTSYTKMRDDWQKEIVARQARMNAMMGEEEKKDVEEAKQEEEEGPDGELFRNILEGKEELNDENM